MSLLLRSLIGGTWLWLPIRVDYEVWTHASHTGLNHLVDLSHNLVYVDIWEIRLLLLLLLLESLISSIPIENEEVTEVGLLIKIYR